MMIAMAWIMRRLIGARPPSVQRRNARFLEKKAGRTLERISATAALLPMAAERRISVA